MEEDAENKNKIVVLHDGFVKLTKDGKFEAVHTTNSVAVLVYVSDLDKIVLINQSRAPMKNDVNPEGTIIEVPAGRFDRKLSVEALVVKELDEEIGAKIDESQVQLVSDGWLAMSPGILTERIYLTYVEITSNQLEEKGRVFGVAAEGEIIHRRILVPVNQLGPVEPIEDLKTWALIQWFFKKREQMRGIKL